MFHIHEAYCNFNNPQTKSYPTVTYIWEEVHLAGGSLTVEKWDNYMQFKSATWLLQFRDHFLIEMKLNISSIQLFFLRKVIRQNDTVVTSRLMQLEKVWCGLLREALWGEGEFYVSLERGGHPNFYLSQMKRRNKDDVVIFL